MSSGLWTATSGARTKTDAIDIVANNLANVDTAGFKKDAPTFREYMSVYERANDSLPIPRGPFKDKDFYPIDGKDQSLVLLDGTYTNFKQGRMRVTQEPFDVALEGPGLLEVHTPNGVRYTRQGSLKLSNEGKLVTAEGFPVLSPGQTQTPPAGNTKQDTSALVGRHIVLRDLQGPPSITENGEIYVNGELLNQLSVVEFKQPQLLRKQGSSLFENPNPSNPKLPEAVNTAIKQGMIEGSNVNPVEEISNMIRANRMFEHDIKAMKTYNDLLGKEASEIGKL